MGINHCWTVDRWISGHNTSPTGGNTIVSISTGSTRKLMLTMTHPDPDFAIICLCVGSMIRCHVCSVFYDEMSCVFYVL